MRGNHRNNRPDNIREWVVEEDGKALLEYMEGLLSDHTRTKVKSMLRHNQFAVNSMPTSRFDTILHKGDHVSVNFDKSFQVFSNPRLKLVYEDEDILVVNKGYGLLSKATDKIKDGTVFSIMRDYVQYHNPNAKVFIVHCLDRNTSGLMMLAKSVRAKEELQHNWSNMILNRKYIAVVEGKVEKEEDTIKSYLAETSQFEVYSTNDPDEGQLAITHYKALKGNDNFTLMEFELKVGRKNQLRVHMKDIGHPIVGDRKYGASSSPLRRVALHAQVLNFVHPITHEVMKFETGVPVSFLGIVK